MNWNLSLNTYGCEKVSLHISFIDTTSRTINDYSDKDKLITYATHFLNNKYLINLFSKKKAHTHTHTYKSLHYHHHHIVVINIIIP